MRRSLIASAVLVLSACAPLKPSPDAAAADSKLAVQTAERAWLDAYERHDAAAMTALVADEFAITYPSGQMLDKAAVLAQVRRSSGASGARFSTEEVQAALLGDTAVLRGVLVFARGQVQRRSRYTDTWIRRDGRWQVAASHLSDLSGAETPIRRQPG